MKLFPYTLIRVGGGSYDALETMEIKETPLILSEIRALEKEAGSLREQLSDYLFKVIHDHEDSTVQKKLLNIKRDVFNGRNLSEGKVAYLRNNLSDHSLLDSYLDNCSQTEGLIAKGEETFKAETIKARKALQGLTRMDNLRKGLVLSSQTLLRACDNYARRNPDKKFKKQDLKTELSLIKYLTRICGKTSPFSTFTHLAMGCFEEGGSGSDVFNGLQEKAEAVGHIRLNNTLFKQLQSLLPHHPDYRDAIRIRPNPTLTRQADHYLYLTNSNNVESFQRIPLNPVLDLFWELSAAEKSGVRHKDLVTKAGEAVDAAPEDLIAYIGQLLEFGFLERNFEVSGIDPDWDIHWGAILEEWDENIPHLSELKEVLKDLRAKAEVYAEKDDRGRIAMLEEAFERFKAIYMTLHEAAGLPEVERMSPEEQREYHLKKKEEEEKEKAESGEDGEAEKSEEDEVFKHMVLTNFNFKPEQMFYEDAALPASYPMDKEAFSEIARTMEQLYDALSFFRHDREDMLNMTHYFKNHYSQPVGMLDFYESYYRDYKKPLAEIKRKKDEEARKKREHENKEPNDEAQKPEVVKQEEVQAEEKGADETDRFKIPAIEELKKDREEWLKRYFEKTTPESLEESKIELGFDPIHEVNKERGVGERHDKTAFGLFLQPFRETLPDGSTRLMAVVNANPMGFGKMVSRFLHIFESRFVDTVREWNRNIDKDAVLLENCDASIFNANLHPPLMPNEVWMPGSQNGLPPEKHIPITEIKIGMDKDKDVVGLFHGDKKLYCFDLCFQSPRGRSELFQMLAKFNPGYYIFFNALFRDINRIAAEREDKTQPYSSPRIVVEDRLVLQRRSWFFPTPSLPEKEPEDTPYSYFRKVRNWQAMHDLPDEVFVSIPETREMEKLDEEARKKLGRDDYKPQYMSFNNPLLIRLFEKIVEKAPNSITLTEMLPGASELVHMGGERYVTEFVMQWETD